MDRKEILLLADSQNLFWIREGQPFLSSFLDLKHDLRAAYIGAANDDKPEFFAIFTAAMEQTGINQTQHIKKQFTAEDRRFLEQANLILLSGGDVVAGWRYLQQSGMAEVIVKRYYEGAFLIGVSAGAIHLGLLAMDKEENVFETLKCVPFVIGVHQEAEEWRSLKNILQKSGNVYLHGLGIPMGSGIVYHPDHTVECIRKPAWLFEQRANAITQQMLLPQDMVSKNKERA